LTCIRAERLHEAVAGTGDAVTGSSSDAAVLDQTGFYPLEKYRGGNAFR
jgi:hypothetical protein